MSWRDFQIQTQVDKKDKKDKKDFNQDNESLGDTFYAIQRTRTGRIIYLTPHKEIMEQNRQAGQAWFLPDEIDNLKGLDVEALDSIIDIKELFAGATVIH